MFDQKTSSLTNVAKSESQTYVHGLPSVLTTRRQSSSSSWPIFRLKKSNNLNKEKRISPTINLSVSLSPSGSLCWSVGCCGLVLSFTTTDENLSITRILERGSISGFSWKWSVKMGINRDIVGLWSWQSLLCVKSTPKKGSHVKVYTGGWVHMIQKLVIWDQ